MSNAWLIGGGAALAALLVASIVVAVIEDDHEFEPGSPEAAVQAFLRAVDSEDLESAYGLLSDALREQCSLEDFAGGPPAMMAEGYADLVQRIGAAGGRNVLVVADAAAVTVLSYHQSSPDCERVAFVRSWVKGRAVGAP